MEIFYGIYEEYWIQQVPEGAHQVGTTHLGAPGSPGAPLVGCAHPGPPPVPVFWYISHFDLEKKIRRGLSGWSATVSRRNLGRSTFALRRSDSAWGTSLPEGEIIVIIITNNPPILGREISINIFNSTNSSQTLVHLLSSIFVPEL